MFARQMNASSIREHRISLEQVETARASCSFVFTQRTLAREARGAISPIYWQRLHGSFTVPLCSLRCARYSDTHADILQTLRRTYLLLLPGEFRSVSESFRFVEGLIATPDTSRNALLMVATPRGEDRIQGVGNGS